jgi:hypothetical protein
MSVPANAAPAEKVDVCHLEGTGLYHLINISDNAYDAHVAHGDARPLEPVPGMAHCRFDENCVPTPVFTLTYMSADKVLSWGTAASVVGDATVWVDYPLEADVHLWGGRFTWNYPGTLHATGPTSNFSVVGNTAEFRMTVDDSTRPDILAGYVLGMRIVDGSPDTIEWWWIAAGTV